MLTLNLKSSRVLKRFAATAVAVAIIGFLPKIVHFTGEGLLDAVKNAACLSAVTVIPSGAAAYGNQNEPSMDDTEKAETESNTAEGTAPSNVQGSSAGTESTTTTTTTATTTTTSATTTTKAAVQDKQSGTKHNINEKQLGSAGTNYKGVWVRNTNSNHSIDIGKELSLEPDINIKLNSQPQVLIIHTHTSECYQNSDRGYYYSNDATRTTDKSKNVVRVADEIEAKLEAAGIKTIHVTTFHDYPRYNGSYARALETINSYLKKYPSIQVVLDIHRDSMSSKDGTKTKPTAVINGKKAAQVMIISGCDDKGNLNFPDWELNMRFALRLQKSMSKKYPGLARPLLFAPFRYNMHATHGSLLIEIGTEVNTLDEAVYSAQMVGNCLVEVLTA